MKANKTNVTVTVNDATSTKSFNEMYTRLTKKFTKSKINVKIVDVSDIKLSDLQDNSNLVRFSGECQNVIQKMVDIIDSGEYEPYRYIPPIVERIKSTDKYVIVSGHHRYKAHLALNKSTMLCVVVEFATERDRSIWRQLENTVGFDGYVKNVTSDVDNISYVTNLVKTGVISGDIPSIQKYAIDAKLVGEKAKKSLNNFVNAVLNNTGNIKDYVKTWGEKKEIVKKLQNKFTNKKFIGVTFKELDDNDYDHRLMVQITNSFIEDPTRPIVVVYSVNGADKKKVEEIRDYKPKHLLKGFLDRWTKIVELQNEGYDLNKLVSLEPMPQLGSEIKGKDSDKLVQEYITRLEKKYAENGELLEKLMKAIKTNSGSELEIKLKNILGGEISTVTTKD